MILGKNICGRADFSFQFFTNGGFIGSICTVCNTKMAFSIEIYKTGKLVEQIINDLDDNILAELIDKNIVNIKNDKNKLNLGLSKYILWNMNALYSKTQCETCKSNYLVIFGMGELQPGREEIQFKGIWKLEVI